MTTLPPTMKAWTVQSNGAPSASTLALTTQPTPAPPTGSNILLKVTHAALNPVDLHLLNVLPTWLPFRRVATPGLDFAGSVLAVGPGVPADSPLAVPGTRVAGSLGVAQIALGTGSLAEYLVVPAALVALQPAGITASAAAGLMGVAGQTATLMLREAGVKSGMRVLVNGASGGVGSLVVQVAQAKGAVVVAVCSGANEGMVRGLGAEEVVDYTAREPVEEYLAERFAVEPFDFIFDTAGSQAIYRRSPAYLKKEGKFISIVGGKSQGVVPFVRNKLLPVFLGGTPRPFRLLGLAPNGDSAKEVAKWVNEGLLKQAPIDQEYAMEDVVQALEKLASKRAKGKIVVRVAGDAGDAA
ncbi:hypothetical protein B0T25DRAFT_477330 [Lasiosphaeria hispida]|uniref:Enoyl reductase (ER) domain-containing protein n=1 Tax=Lasiosphaeria hispida TaxID=260671 RepID=A0AAJ0MGU3_9PEZI|nr:hypothetical protein B0T25DRAFT_477330 [Lasiosphaeria hispida]